MSKTLFIVESPGKIKKISSILGPDYIVKATMGHFVDLTNHGKYRMGIDLDNDFKIDYAPLKGRETYIDAITAVAKNVDEIMIASDDDREGEAIAWHLVDLLKKFKKPLKRVVFKEITKPKILAAVKNPRQLNKELYAAQQARRVLDRIVGFSVSPYIIKRFGPNLSAGRVQSVTLKIIVDREREIEKFEPDEYWNLTSALTPSDDKSKFIAKYDNKIDNEKDALKVKKDLETDTYTVEEVTGKETLKKPNPPFITSSLATAAAGKFKFAAARTMKAAQTLYESGHITYLRTDSVRISEEAIEDAREWLKKNSYPIPAKPNIYATSDASQNAHEAIRPTYVASKVENLSLTDDEKKIYKLIWERFVASQMNPAVYDTVNVTIKTSSNHKLKANGRILKSEGWLSIMSDSDASDKDVKLPLLDKGDKLTLVPPKVKAEQKFTQPPPRYSEGTLIKELEKRGIGRPATLAAIMTKIAVREYVEAKSNILYPTDLGKKVVDCLTQFFKFMEVPYTANMETELDKIADGKLEYVEMIKNFYELFKIQLKSAYVAKDTELFDIKCKSCGAQMVAKNGKFGEFLACSTYPECKNTLKCKIIDGVPVPEGMYGPLALGQSCPVCNLGMFLREGKFGKFYSCIEYPKCKGTRKVPYGNGKMCKQCGDDLFLVFHENGNFLSCVNFPKCRYSESLPKEEKKSEKKKK
jgi:DNA topoisomerase-1